MNIYIVILYIIIFKIYFSEINEYFFLVNFFVLNFAETVLTLLLYNKKEREKQTDTLLALFAFPSLRCVSHSSFSNDCLTVYLPLKLENSWYPILYESTDRNELASVVGRCELFPIRSFFTYSSVYFRVLHPLLFAALLYLLLLFSPKLSLSHSLSRSGLSAKW